MAKRDAALAKRQQIAKASRMMFIWITAASVVVGAASVALVFMVRKATFNSKVLSVQNKTIDTLKANNATVEKLRENVRLLDTNDALASAKAFSDEQPIRVILDALPDSENVPALGASLQKELVNVPGVELDSLSFASVASNGGTAVEADSGEIPFDMKLIADNSRGTSPTKKLSTVLQNLERSIRTINIKNMKLEISSEDTATLTVSAVAYYRPAVNLDLKEVQVSP